MKNSRLVLILSTVIILGMFSCKKGDVGPAGPAGPAGPDSVSTSAWITLNMSVDTTIGTTTYYVQEIAAPAITQTVLDSGIILGYFKYADPSQGTQVFNASEAANITYSVGNAEVLSVGNDWTGYFDFRYVIVPGTLTLANSIKSGRAKGLTKSQLQNMSYSEVQNLLKNSSSSQ